MILLKQAAQMVPAVFEALATAQSALLVAVRDVSAVLEERGNHLLNLSQLCDPVRIEPIVTRINGVINEDVVFSKSPLDLRNQRCYAVKVCQSHFRM